MPSTSPNTLPDYRRVNQLFIALTKLQESHVARHRLVSIDNADSAELVSVAYKVHRLGRPLTTTHGWVGAGQANFDAVVREIIELVRSHGAAIARSVNHALQLTDRCVAERASHFLQLAQNVFADHADLFDAAFSDNDIDPFASLLGIPPQRIAG